MAKSNELQVLEKITTEVDEAQIKVILATQCIKAQAFLVGKLKKQVQHNNETCGYISNANMKLQSEINQAEQEIKSFLIANDTIKMANVELKKELLLAKEKKLDLIERVESGENRYEELWLECKNRYESLSYVQKLLKAAETAQNLKDKIADLDRQAESLDKEIQAKRVACVNADRNRIIELGKFIIHERPKMIQEVNKKSKAITDMMNEMKSININTTAVTEVAEKEKMVIVEETNSIVQIIDDIKNMDESSLIMPTLQMDMLDIDDLISVKLEQVKMKKVDNIGLEKKESFSKSYFDITTSIFNRKTDIDEEISSYFCKPSATDEDKEQNFSKKKLINILEDVRVDAIDAQDMISKVNPDTLQEVVTISAEATSSAINSNIDSEASITKEQIQNDEIQDIDMTTSNAEDIVKPPTQFLDGSLKSQKSQEHKKTVSFDLSTTSQYDAISGNTDKIDVCEENVVNKTINTPLDVSIVSDDGFDKIKDMVLKKHNLDLTPPFVYAKKPTVQIKTDEKVVTSKFFRNDESKQQEIESEIQLDKPEDTGKNSATDTNKIMELEDDIVMASSPKRPKISDELCKPDKPYSEYQLFSHGPQGIPESLDVSMSTTGYEDNDDFPHYIDSNLLLSPKADIPICDENPEVKSQEAPNFLSGLRKTGMSFFGHMGGGNSNPDSAPNQGSSGFSFNFGGDEKKNRGGLFSMFQ